jgi:hypothetical protein|mmetsp:Transcript_12955/g.31421  ORF Transcript_12955/g.31421 Transcript_12955/m.31421 type:complete len:205 (-) Transcript_12955:61-675(-)
MQACRGQRRQLCARTVRDPIRGAIVGTPLFVEYRWMLGDRGWRRLLRGRFSRCSRRSWRSRRSRRVRAFRKDRRRQRGRRRRLVPRQRADLLRTVVVFVQREATSKKLPPPPLWLLIVCPRCSAPEAPSRLLLLWRLLLPPVLRLWCGDARGTSSVTTLDRGSKKKNDDGQRGAPSRRGSRGHRLHIQSSARTWCATCVGPAAV